MYFLELVSRFFIIKDTDLHGDTEVQRVDYKS